MKKETGRRLKQARKNKGMSLEDLSRETGGALSATRISNYEQGTRRPQPEEAIILSKSLGITPSYVLCLSDDPETSSTGVNFNRLVKAITMAEEELEEFGRMSARERAKFIAYSYRLIKDDGSINATEVLTEIGGNADGSETRGEENARPNVRRSKA